MFLSRSRCPLLLFASLFVIAGGFTSTLSLAASPAKGTHVKRAQAARAPRAAKADMANAPANLAPAIPATAPVTTTALAAASSATVTAAQPAKASAVSTGSQASVNPSIPVPDSVYQNFAGKMITHGPASGKLVALSFDDGPSPKLTPQVIEILNANNIKATFFEIGQSVQHYPQISKMLADQGFEVGCHTLTHPRPWPRMSDDALKQEIVGSADMVEQATGKKPHLFRAPYGAGFSKPIIRETCAEKGLTFVHWSVDPRDWDTKSTPESVYEKVMKQVHPGAIVCIHDIHARTIAALPRIITDLKAQGYQFVTVGQMLAETEKHPNEMPALAGGGLGGGVAVGAAAMPETKPAAIPLSQSGLK